jgi:YggT family protein
MNNPILIFIMTIVQVLSLVIIADALMSFVLPPTHPVRETLGRILAPIYAPIRRILPQTGMFDFTPLVALILLRVLVMVFQSIF